MDGKPVNITKKRLSYLLFEPMAYGNQRKIVDRQKCTLLVFEVLIRPVNKPAPGISA